MFREGLERTTKELAASAPSAMKIKVAAPPDLEVPAAKRLIRTCMPASHFSFGKLAAWPRIGCARWRVTLPTPMKKLVLRQGCIRPQFFDSCVMGFVFCCESMEKRLLVCRQMAPRLVFLATVAVLLQQSAHVSSSSFFERNTRLIAFVSKRFDSKTNFRFQNTQSFCTSLSTARFDSVDLHIPPARLLRMLHPFFQAILCLSLNHENVFEKYSVLSRSGTDHYVPLLPSEALVFVHHKFAGFCSGSLGRAVQAAAKATHSLTCGVPDRESNAVKYLLEATEVIEAWQHQLQGGLPMSEPPSEHGEAILVEKQR